MKLPFFGSVAPPHVFCLLDEGVTYARVRPGSPAGFEESRHFPYPGGPFAPGAPVRVTREALSEAVRAARALSGGKLSRASVVYPDAWARILPVELETLPTADDAGREMVNWKLKKLLPAGPGDVAVVWRAMPVVSEEKRVLVATAHRETMESIESAFEELGVRVGYLAPASLAILEGLSSILSAGGGKDYGLLHRSAGGTTFFIVRDRDAIFFRQRPADDDDPEREARLSLSYYAEKLKGPGLSAVYVHDELSGRPLEKVVAFPIAPVALSSRVLGADPDFDARVASQPELMAGFAAVVGGR
ncbi:MAG TPA: hypothetical protein VH854_03160 [Thermoanaerobaculia bacterium]|jgi:hypothetical protein|nr:hypothetical protein [Thermoanaerobaculia bacterium]